MTKNYVFRLLKLYIIWSAIYLPLYVEDMFKPGEKLWYFVLIYIRSFIFIGSYTQLWYFPALIFGIIITSFLLYKKVKPRTLIYLATFFYLIGLLTQSWFGIIEPLRYKSPLFWSFLKLVQSIIYTTRDGLFEGFLFVGIGMLFALKNITLSKRKALVGFIISMFLMLIEAFFLKYFSFVRESNTYLF